MDGPFIGEIRAFGGIMVPKEWSWCDGSLLSIEKYPSLYLLIGTRYGGDGETNFALPDLRSRVPMGQSHRNAAGHKGGSEFVELTVENLPVHRHVPACSTANESNSKDATDAFWAASAESGRRYAPAPGDITMNAGSIQPEGGSQPHENRMPVLAVSYIIALLGVFPQFGQ